MDIDEAEFAAEVAALADHSQFQAILERSRQSLQEQRGISLEVVMAEFGVKPPV